jgi:hypothetical protein
MPDPIPDAIRAKVRTPAICLIVLATLGLLFGLVQAAGVAIIFGVMAADKGLPDGHEAVSVYSVFGGGTLAGLLAAFMYLIVLIGAVKMKNLTSYGFAMTAAILSMLTCCSLCEIVGLPLGIWALVVLCAPDVKAAFR